VPEPEHADSSGSLATRAKIAIALVLVVAASLVITGALPGMNPVSAGPDSPLLGVLFVLALGATIFYFGWRQYREFQLARNTPTSTVRSLAVGAAEIHGEAQPVDEPLTSPLTGTSAVLYEIEVQEISKSDEGGANRILQTRDEVPLRIDDGTGAVRVDPQEAKLVVDTEQKTRIEAGEEPPEPLVAWAREGFREGTRYEEAEAEDLAEVFQASTVGIDDEVASYLSQPADRDRVVEESVIAVDEPVYVWGAAHRREGTDDARNERNLVIREHDGTGTFVVSDGSEGELREHQIDGALWMLGTSVVFLVFGITTLLDSFGLV
jgi:hypothetical protein